MSDPEGREDILTVGTAILTNYEPWHSSLY